MNKILVFKEGIRISNESHSRRLVMVSSLMHSVQMGTHTISTSEINLLHRNGLTKDCHLYMPE